MASRIQWDLARVAGHFEPSHGLEQHGIESDDVCLMCKHSYWPYELKVKPSVDTLQSLLDRYTSPRCFICRIKWNTYARALSSPEDIHTFSPSFQDIDGRGLVLTRVTWGERTGDVDEEGEVLTQSHELEIHVDTEGHSIYCAPQIQHSFHSSELWLSVQKRLDACFKTHEQCRSQDATLPHRLLDLQDLRLPILIDGTQSIGHIQYAALSYCWGGVHFLRTTSNSIGQHKQGISLDNLPVLFRDIITICGYLGVRYLWIDSLCIIQDCEEDWAIESSKMRHIFANSFVVLSAGNTPNPNRGLKFERNEPLIVDHLPGSPGGKLVPVFARPQIKHESWSTRDKGDAKFWEGTVNHNYLESRAWCYQESYLANRVLHLLDLELMLRCNEEYWCECRGEDCPLACEVEDFRCLNSTSDVDRLAKIEDRDILWRRFISDYSALDISFPTDRFPAFAGIAAAFQEPDFGRYLAGFWEVDLPGCLLWELEKPWKCAMKPRPEKYVAPSWSWASVMDAVEPSRDLARVEDEILVDADCLLVSDNHFGQVAKGFVKLRARLAPAVCFFKMDETWFVRPRPDFILPAEEDANIAEESVVPGEAYLKGVPVAFDSINDYEMTDKDRLVLAGFQVYVSGDHSARWRVLLLQTVNEEQVYRRVGIVRHEDSWSSVWSVFFETYTASIFTMI